MKIPLPYLFLIILVISGNTISKGQAPEASSIYPPATLNLSYHGNNLWNPGLNAGIEQPWSVSQKADRKSRPVILEKYFNADLGFFRDYSRQTPFFSHLGINRRRYREDKGGFHFQFGFSPVGIYRSFLPETWEYKTDGTVEKVFLPGRWYYAPVVSMGLGRFHNNKPGTGWFVEMNITTLIPYNTYVMPLLNIKAGFRIPMKKQIINF
jgi:hypothetical protein